MASLPEAFPACLAMQMESLSDLFPLAAPGCSMPVPYGGWGVVSKDKLLLTECDSPDLHLSSFNYFLSLGYSKCFY